MSTSASPRERIGPIMRDLAGRYLPGGDLRQGQTALARIVAEREDPFLVLISTILSQRTRDEMTSIASRQLFAKYDTPRAIAAADPGDLERLIKPVGFYRQKSLQIQRVSRVLLERYGGTVPRTYEELIELPQVGPKTANCVLVYGFGEARIPTDTHVHRVSNRIGLVRTKTPEATEQRLMKTIPKAYWLEINELFIRFGKDICRPIGPRCPACSFTSFCRFYRTVVQPRIAARARRDRRNRTRSPRATRRPSLRVPAKNRIQPRE
ncbi:MAG: endonuclease III [Thermoplasmata archaeon]|nr:endonuclease III [Thermoplasmata archaeon]